MGALFLVPNFFGPEGDSGVTQRYSDEPVMTRFQRRGANYSVIAKVVFLAEHAVHIHSPHYVHFRPGGRFMATVYPNGCVPGAKMRVGVMGNVSQARKTCNREAMQG